MNHGRRRNLAGVLIVAVSVAGVVAAFAAVGNGSREPSSASAVTPVSFSLQGLDGDEVSAAQLRGSVTVLAFVQAGCASCAYTLHELAAASGPDIRTLAVGFPLLWCRALAIRPRSRRVGSEPPVPVGSGWLGGTCPRGERHRYRSRPRCRGPCQMARSFPGPGSDRCPGDQRGVT